MAFEIVFRPQAIRDLDRLDPQTRKRIVAKLTWFSEQKNPLSFAHPLKDTDLGSYRFRVGDWRVVIDVSDNTIVVLVIDHRKDVYR